MYGVKKEVPGGTTQTNTENYITMQKMVSMLRAAGEPMTRTDLVREMGMEDRAVRDIITFARLQGQPICSRSDRKGYWIGDEYDVGRLVKDYRCRAKSLNAIADALEQKVLQTLEERKEGEQICMEGLDIWADRN